MSGIEDSKKKWSIKDSAQCYGIDRWGLGHFAISEAGVIQVISEPGSTQTADLLAVVEDLAGLGYKTPLLLRFSDILRSRIEELNRVFASAITECEYKGNYRGVFPIKVNQARTVVEEVVHFGAPFHYGLEAGSKAELIAILAVHRDREALVICNGYKDDDYIEMALLGSSLGATVALVAEKPSELERIHRASEKLGISACYGIRVRISSPGAGKWHQSGGDLSKFGFTVPEVLKATETLRDWGELSNLKLMHFHLGSQVSAIGSIKDALREATVLYAELCKLGCDGLDHLDVGGGLGVDYDGSQSNSSCSLNYSMQEYANDVVHEVMKGCDQAGVAHPHLVSESGRAITAHHSILVVPVLEVSRCEQKPVKVTAQDLQEPTIRDLHECYAGIDPTNLVEAYHDVQGYRDQAKQLFSLGHLGLAQRALCDQLFWASCSKIDRLLKDHEEIPVALQKLERLLCDTYFLNFSLFQSLPDSWAVDQVFPVMPIHRLDEEPTRRAVLADITCDSDGRVDRFPDARSGKNVLELHERVSNKPYYLGFFLVGAYQEILGDLHNLFGDTNTIHVSMHEGGYEFEDVFPGETMSEVLGYLNYDAQHLQNALDAKIEEAKLDVQVGAKLSKAYAKQLRSITYIR